MRFAPDQTKQYFEPRPGGGTHTVVAADPTDRHRVTMIRERLQQDIDAFARGEFGGDDVSGHALPELETLEEHHEEIDFVFTKVPGGAQIEFKCKSEDLVDVLRKWLDQERNLQPEAHDL